MTEPAPHDGISAFFDEELSPSERKEMADQLSHSRAAQQELADIARLSEELRTLPRESVPRALLPDVMSQIQAKSLQQTAGSNEFPKRRWGVGKVFAAAVALAIGIAWLPSIWTRPDSDKSDSTIAAHTPNAVEPNDRGELAFGTKPIERGDEKRAPRPLGSEGELLVQKDRSRMLADGQAVPGQIADSNAGFDTPPPPAPPMQMGVAAATLPQRFAAGDKITQADSQVKELMESAANGEDRVVILELTVEDPKSTLKQLQTLLAQNAVAPATFGLNESATEENRKEADADSEVALYVQSTPEQLAGSLQSLRELQPVSRMHAVRNLALSEILLKDGEVDEAEAKVEKSNRVPENLAKVLRKYQSVQVAQGFGGKNAETSGTRFKQEPSADDRTARTGNAPGGLEKTPSVAGARAFMLPAKGAEPQNRRSGAQSFQMIVQTAKDSWQKESPPKPIASVESKKTPEPEAERANALADQIADPSELAPQENAAPKPIRTLFIFRAAPKEPAK